GWLTSFLQVLHWFNPLVWFAFYRMRTDRELACDALVLARTQKEESQEYGRAIVGLLRRFSRSRPLPAMAGILENRSQLKRRITMIARFKKNSYQWSPLAVLLIVVLACVSLPDARRMKAAGISTAKPASTICLRMVTDRWGTETCVSPDGRYMCYVDWTTSDLVVREIATGKMQRLTDKGSWRESNAIPSDPVISPDNTRVTYVRNYVEGKKRDLYVAALDGSGELLLCKGEEALPVPLDWSENGHEILAGIRGEDEKVHLLWVSTSDGSIREITTLGEASPSRVDLSPHGRYVAYDYPQTDGESKRDILVYDLKNQSQIAVVEHPADDKLLGWTPDGRSVFFASNRTGTWDGWIVEFGDAQLKHAPRLVKTALGDARPVGLTQKGEFYFGLTEYRSDVYAGRINIKTGEVIEAAKPVGQTGNEGDPDWSADGRYLAYCSRRPSDKSQVIRILSMESGKERELDPNLPYFRWLHWCLDGQSLLAGEFEGASPQVMYRIDAETGQRSIFLGSEAHLIGAPAASNDGKKLLYIRRMRNKLGEHQSEAESERALVIRDLETGQEHELPAPKRPREHGSLIRFFVAPDGRRLALVVSESDPFVSSKNYMHVRWPAVVLKTISAEDSRITELFRSENSEEIHSVDWTSDGRSLLFWRTVDPSPGRKAEEQTGLWRISTKGSEPEHFWTPKSWTPKVAVSDVRVHPGTGRVAFQARQQIWQLWVMENFLPAAPVAKPAHQPNFRKIRIPTKPGNGVLSPDGKKLAFVSKRSIWVVPVHGKVSPDIA
ncbi:MAG: PD40 domain-containing protein, partial [Phycisphaerales bacterium]